MCVRERNKQRYRERKGSQTEREKRPTDTETEIKKKIIKMAKHSTPIAVMKTSQVSDFIYSPTKLETKCAKT